MEKEELWEIEINTNPFGRKFGRAAQEPFKCFNLLIQQFHFWESSPRNDLKCEERVWCPSKRERGKTA